MQRNVITGIFHNTRPIYASFWNDSFLYNIIMELQLIIKAFADHFQSSFNSSSSVNILTNPEATPFGCISISASSDSITWAIWHHRSSPVLLSAAALRILSHSKTHILLNLLEEIFPLHRKLAVVPVSKKGINTLVTSYQFFQF